MHKLPEFWIHIPDNPDDLRLKNFIDNSVAAAIAREYARLDAEAETFLKMGFDRSELMIVQPASMRAMDRFIAPRCAFPEIQQ